MAPLRGVTDEALRASFAKHFGGFDRAVAPFLNPQGRGGPRQTEIALAGRSALDPLLPSVPQLLTADSADFLSLATLLAQAGCSEINWNLGCSHVPVIRGGRGAGLLPHPDRIASILDRVVPRCPTAISIKMRLGLHDPDESLAVLEVLERYPIVEVIIHARLGVQMFRGTVDLDAFGRCLERARHPVVYNGDLVDNERFRAVAERFPSISAFMLGRGALEDPTLPALIKGREINGEERALRLRLFHDELYADARSRFSGPGHVLGRMKGLWLYLGPASSAEKRFLRRVRRATSFADYEAASAAALG